MKAVVTTRYGPPSDVLRLSEIETPETADDEVLIRLSASSVNPLDSFTIRGPLAFLPSAGRLLKPKHNIAGADYAGRVESVGRKVMRFRPGDEVFGASFTGKGLGGFAEFSCVREDNLALKPSNLSLEDAAAVPIAAITALQGLRDQGHIQAGQKVVIDGASGGVGTFAVQIAKSFGAEVTAVCSCKNVDKARQIGADYVVDYTRQDFTRNGLHYDLIFAVNGNHSIFDYRRSLSREGVVVIAGGGLMRILLAMCLNPLLSQIGKKKMRIFIAKIKGDDLLVLKNLLESGKLVPVIDRRYPLAEVAEAVRYREEGHAHGKVVITVGG